VPAIVVDLVLQHWCKLFSFRLFHAKAGYSQLWVSRQYLAVVPLHFSTEAALLSSRASVVGWESNAI
jgi:hypothetical protein